MLGARLASSVSLAAPPAWAGFRSPGPTPQGIRVLIASNPVKSTAIGHHLRLSDQYLRLPSELMAPVNQFPRCICDILAYSSSDFRVVLDPASLSDTLQELNT